MADWGSWESEEEVDDVAGVPRLLGHLVAPGTPVGEVDPSQWLVGTGLYSQGDTIYSCLLGTLKIQPAQSEGPATLYIDAGIQRGSASSYEQAATIMATARVNRITNKEVRCDVLSLEEESEVSAPCRGIIRITDILETGIDRVSLLDCFRPGDVIRAAVVATGVSKVLLLSTTPKTCGVIHAVHSLTGKALRPVSSSVMVDDTTGSFEFRKVACPAEKS